MEILQHTFFTNALITGLLTAIVCGIIGSFMVVRRMLFVGGGITHASFGGLGLGFYLGINPIAMAAVFAIASALGIDLASRSKTVREDSAIAAIWAIGMALGILFISLTPGYQTDLSSYLFGNILLVSTSDLWWLTGFAVMLIGGLWWRYKELVYVSFDPDFARTQGIRSAMYERLMLVFMAVGIVLSIRAIGIMLLMSLVSLPQNTIGLFTSNFKIILAGSILTGFVGCAVGLFASFYSGLPSGAFIILLLAVMYLLAKCYKSFMLKPKSIAS